MKSDTLDSYNSLSDVIVMLLSVLIAWVSEIWYICRYYSLEWRDSDAIVGTNRLSVLKAMLLSVLFAWVNEMW